MMSFVAENAAFETWLRRQCDVVDADLDFKHERMAASPFNFLRATFFRWASGIAAICPDLAESAAVTTVGDIHVENFGTWRDADGRLVWGINDFDEAAVIPWAFDLLRVATSARLAPNARIDDRDAVAAILEGYATGIGNPHPALLDEHETWMRPYVALSEHDRKQFWKELAEYPTTDSIPPAAEQGLRQSLPQGATIERLATRRKGGGSLGRPRFVAIAQWRGGRIVREAKALVPSAWTWAHGTDPSSRFTELALAWWRSPDPFLDVQDGFIVRRIAADSRKVEFDPGDALELHHKLLGAMGSELAFLHKGANPGRDLLGELKRFRPGWLQRASKDAAAWVKADHREWKGRADHS